MHDSCKFGRSDGVLLTLYLHESTWENRRDRFDRGSRPGISFDPSVSFRPEEAEISGLFCREFTTIEFWKALLERFFRLSMVVLLNIQGKCSCFRAKPAHFSSHLPHPYYGYRRIAAQLHREGRSINQKTVARYMQEMGLVALYPGPNLSKRAQQAAIFPYLLANVTANAPNHIWGIDITYIRLRAGWMYLVAILDWYSRFVVSWELDQTMQIAFVMEAMQRALERATPQICNSDQGSQFTRPQYTQLLLSHKVRISMDSKGRALDNIFTERLWRTIKYEEVYLKDYASPREARHELRDYLRFYNEQRIHQALDYQTPAEVYFARRLDNRIPLQGEE